MRKIKRAYPTDNALIYLFKSTMDEDFFGRVVETLIVNKTGALSFWKNGGEVDIIKDGTPVEVKYKNNIDISEFKHLLEFMKKFGKSEGFIVTKSDEKVVEVKGNKIKLIPAWKWMLE
ncbi:MAG: hypothetical protein Q8P57_01845 [Candidatus Pacearchaeota archaeon]|nr:hypothetical protein [Candidatus Pacearchaeota archaeon]